MDKLQVELEVLQISLITYIIDCFGTAFERGQDILYISFPETDLWQSF